MKNNEGEADHPGGPALKGKLKVGFVLARSFTLSAFALFIDTLRLASDQEDRSGRVFADWQVLGSSGHLIASSCGVRVAPTSNLADPTRFDYIVVVGGLLSVETPVDDETIAFLHAAALQKIPLIGLCTGTFILAEAGLMRNHETCVSWLHAKTFRERFPKLRIRSDRLFNLDQQRGSCAGGSSTADMAALLVRKYIGRDAERNALEVLQIEKARTARDVQPRRPLREEYADPRIKTVLLLMEQHIDDGIEIDDLASFVGLSRRQLERVFIRETGMSPAKAFTRLRLEYAKTILVKSERPMIEVALDIGFDNASHFSRAFKRMFGQTPSEHRTSFAKMQR